MRLALIALLMICNLANAQMKVRPQVLLDGSVSILRINGINKNYQVGIVTDSNRTFISPQFSLGYSHLFSSGLMTNEIHLGAGCVLKERMSLRLNLWGIQDARAKYAKSSQTLEPHRLIALSFNPSYRIVDFWISPIISVDAGKFIYSNAKNRFLNSNFSLQPEINGSNWARYRRGLLFSKVELLLDFKIENFNVQLGGSFNYYLFELSFSNEQTIFWSEKGFGLNARLLYTLRNRAVKKDASYRSLGYYTI